MSAMRSRMRSKADARLGPGERRAGAGVDAEAEPEVLAAVHTVEAELGRVLELARVAVRGAVDAASPSCPPGGRPRRSSSGRGTGGTHPGSGSRAAGLLDEASGCASRSSRSSCWQLGTLADHLEHRAEQARRGLLAGREEVGGDQHDVVDLRQRPVGEGRGGQLGHHVVARCAASVLDVGREALVEELQRLVRHRSRPSSASWGASRPGAPRGTSRGRLRERRADRR